MLKNAWKEVRYHPGRVVATLIAIAISVAFIAGAAVFLATEQSAIAKQGSIQYSASDIVVQPDLSGEPGTDAQQVADKIKAVDGIEAVDATYVSGLSMSKPGGQAASIVVISTPAEGFRWSKITEGAWAQKADELTLTKQVAGDLDAKVGDTIYAQGQPMRVVGISDDPTTRLNVYAYAGPEFFTSQEGGGSPAGWSANITDGADIDKVVADLNAAVPGYQAQTAAAAMEESINQLAGGVEVFRYIFGVFQFIAIVVGMIIIANTFTILITQRRRQIGLLRAVGASSDQVQRMFLGEALLLGMIGSLFGIVLGYLVAMAGSWYTGSIQFGVGFPWFWLLIAFGVGTLVTVAAAYIPIQKTTTVSPLEALQPVLSADKQRKASGVRAIVMAAMFAIGVVLAVLTFVGPRAQALWFAGGASFFLIVSVLFSASLYVPTLLRLLGRSVSWTGPTARLAVMNSARNPQRAGATALALMLAMGLIVGLQVGTSTVRGTFVNMIEEQFPVDMTLATMTPMKPEHQALVKKMQNIDQITALSGGMVTSDSFGDVAVLAADDKLSAAAPKMPAVTDDTVFVGSGPSEGSKLTLTGKDGTTVTLTVKRFGDVMSGQALVSQATMQKLVATPEVYGYWIKVKDTGQVAEMQQELLPLFTSGEMVMMGGGALIADLVNTILDILLAVVTALLGVAVVIALVGVANTLGLSVIERRRESALLRALGMKRGSLRYMLLIEAVLLAITGTLVGLVGGAGLAWLGLSGLFRAIDLPLSDLKFSINIWQTLILLGVAVVCAGLASILPGRRAALASPTEALAID
ncbi:ABC transporter permease [Propionibacteriaceae bacterium G1746]|uniref:ABC transporter permease n=1 Tax=Aestuariimicrobium sp. G57 TaxID=3418485 RepID=UPI003C274419